MKQPLHNGKHLFWRGVVAAIGSTAMAVGVYPLLPHLGMVEGRRRLGLPNPPGQLKVVVREWVVSVGLALARPIGFFGLPVSLRKVHGPRPIIVIHGYAMNRANFLLLARRLTRAGLGPVYGFEYWSLGKTSSAARRLGGYVDAVRAATGAEKVDLIGHSMGGMVSRYYISLGGGADNVKNLITIGSPHGGTGVSGFGVGRPNHELYPGSSLLERLESARLPPEIAITAIWSRSDALVPQTRAGHIRGVEQLTFDDLGHLTMLTSRRVADEIIARLRR